MKLYLWDIDGTLVLYRGAGRRAAEQSFQSVFKINDVAERTRGVDFAGATDGRIMREMANTCNINNEQFDANLVELKSTYLRMLRTEISQFDDDPTLPGVLDLLHRQASTPNIRLGLLTGNYENGARIKLGPIGLNRYFSVGGFGDDHEERRIVAKVARDRSCEFHKIELPPSDVIVVGDTIHDVDCARANGFRSIAVCTGRFDAQTLTNAGADLVIEDLTRWSDL